MTPFDRAKHYNMIKAAVRLGLRSNASHGWSFQVGRVLAAHGISISDDERRSVIVDAMQDVVMGIVNPTKNNPRYSRPKTQICLDDNRVPFHFGKDPTIRNKPNNEQDE